MCGIVAVLNKKNSDVTSALLSSLAKLEYRGYDSAGCSLQQSDGAIQTYKVVGGVAVLAETVSAERNITASKAALAHTRWATHGAVDIRNAHPHVSPDKRFSLVHNGVVDNLAELKKSLSHRPLQSDTDTEVVLACLEQAVAAGMETSSALDTVAKRIQGQYALLLLDAQQPGCLWAVCSGSPLVVGYTEQQLWWASDTHALPACKRWCHMPEGAVFSCRWDPENPLPTLVPGVAEALWQSWQALHHPLDHTDDVLDDFTYREMLQQPAMLRQIARTAAETATPVKACEFTSSSDLVVKKSISSQEEVSPGPAWLSMTDKNKLAQAHQVFLVGCGSSFYAARYWAGALEQQLGVACRAELATTFLDCPPVLGTSVVLITFSQSGETMDTLVVLRQLKAQCDLDLYSIAVGNHESSSISRLSDSFWPCEAGREIGVATTKAFTAQLAVGAQLMASWQRQVWPATAMVQAAEQALALLPVLAGIAQTREQDRSMFYLARGLGVPLAQEGALKLKELAYVHAEAYAMGELKHGPLALIEPHFLSVLLLDKAYLTEQSAACQAIIARGGDVLLMGDQASIAALQQEIALDLWNSRVSGVLSFSAESSCSWSWAVFVTIVMQGFAYYMAKERGCCVDKPRNLAKSVTVV